jgi:hypothetical protein
MRTTFWIIGTSNNATWTGVMSWWSNGTKGVAIFAGYNFIHSFADTAGSS